MTYVWDFDEGIGQGKDRLGGKGANLVEMVRLGLAVPPGFVVSTDACRDYLAAGQRLPDGLMAEVAEHLAGLEQAMGRRLGDPRDPLLVSVRSGAPVSMPGMMDTVLNLGLTREAVEGLAAQSGDERFALDAYRRFLQMFGEIVLGVDPERLAQARRESLGDVDDPGALEPRELQALVDALTEVVGEAGGSEVLDDPRAQLEGAVRAVFDSWNGARARRYRRLEGIPDDLGTAVNVQAMVFGNLGDDSGTGVAFTRDPSTGDPRPRGDWLANAQGEDVVAGIRATKDLDDLAEAHRPLHDQLVESLQRLERHFRDLQDVEFTIERGTLWILQTRDGKRSARAAVRVAVELAEEGVIERHEALRRVEPAQMERLLHPQFDPDADYAVAAAGLAASPGAATGQVAFTADEAEERAAAGEAVILVRTETSPEDVHGLAAARGVLTTRGGLVSHAAIVARGMGKPAVCGAADVVVDPAARTLKIGGDTVGADQVLSIDGTTGEVVLGEVPVVEPEPDEALRTLLSWADEVRRLKVRANADAAEDARRARELGAEGIGLCRTEHQFLGDRLPLIRQWLLARDDATERAALVELEKAQRADFETLLAEMDGLPVTVRLLDPPMHEFLPDLTELVVAEARGELDEEGHALLEAARDLVEDNPMMGVRGVRLAVLHPGLYRMQVRALLGAARARREAGGDPRVEIMVPLVATTPELQLAAEWVAEAAGEIAAGDGGDGAGAGGGDVGDGGAGAPPTRKGYALGTMVETPRAALVADGLAEHADFFSFGTNDLTQLTFGFSRDDLAGRLIDPYVEQRLLPADPFRTLDVAVADLVQHACTIGRGVRGDLELGICGEHAGDPASIRRAHGLGLDYVSCSTPRLPVARLAAAQAVLDEREKEEQP